MKRMRKNSKFCYGLGSLGHGFYNAFITAFLNIYLTDTFGLSGTALGLLFIIARVWDAVNDPMMGMITDRTKTKIGKFRPYLLLSPIVMAVSMVLLFTVPDIGNTWKIVWAYVFYILYGMSSTAYGISYSSAAYVVTADTKDRDNYMAFGAVINIAATCVVSIFGLSAINAFSSEAKGYQYTVMMLAMLACVMAWINGFKNRELRESEQKEKNSLKDYWEIVAENKPFQRMIAVNILITTAINIPLGMLLYYLKYVLEDESPYMIIMIILLVIQFVVMSLTPKICHRFGKKQSMMAAFLSMLVGAIVLLVAYKNIMAIYAGCAVIGVGTAIYQVSINILAADTVDYAQWTMGKHSEGLVFSMVSFANKLATAFVGGVIGFGLSIIGYQANQIQTGETILGMRILMTMVPVVLEVVSILVFKNYELDTATLERMHKELEAK